MRLSGERALLESFLSSATNLQQTKGQGTFGELIDSGHFCHIDILSIGSFLEDADELADMENIYEKTLQEVLGIIDLPRVLRSTQEATQCQ